MTLEEKIIEWALRAASVNCESAYRAGANRMLSELLPVMKEMKEALTNLEPFCNERLDNFQQWRTNYNVVVFQFNNETITTDHLKQIKSALEKYNALFQDKQKQS